MRMIFAWMCCIGSVFAVIGCNRQSDSSDPSAAGFQASPETTTTETGSPPESSPTADTPMTHTEHPTPETATPETGPDSAIGSQTNTEPPTIPADAKFVAATGDDAWPGTESQPWRNILPSFQKLNPGDTLVIRGGTYTATGSSELCGDGISPFAIVGLQGKEESWTTIMGYPGERPRLYHPDGWQTLYICESSYVRIRHLEVFGDANEGNTSPANGVYAVGSHHVVVEDVWSHDNGGCGICTTDSNHVTIHGNRVWGTSHWNPYHSSGISIYYASNEGGGDSSDGYSNRVTQNLVWNNYEDDTLGVGQEWGVTDGNGIIIDRNKESGGRGRTLIRNNVLADNGGPGVMITESHAVDIYHNTLYQNVRTRVPTVVNNGEIGCNGGYDIRIEGNIVVPRNDNPNLFQSFYCKDFSHANNVWVKTKAPKYGAGDISLPTASRVLNNPQLVAPAGDWTPIGKATGRGAR